MFSLKLWLRIGSPPSTTVIVRAREDSNVDSSQNASSSDSLEPVVYVKNCLLCPSSPRLNQQAI